MSEIKVTGADTIAAAKFTSDFVYLAASGRHGLFAGKLATLIATVRAKEREEALAQATAWLHGAIPCPCDVKEMTRYNLAHGCSCAWRYIGNAVDELAAAIRQRGEGG